MWTQLCLSTQTPVTHHKANYKSFSCLLFLAESTPFSWNMMMALLLNACLKLKKYVLFPTSFVLHLFWNGPPTQMVECVLWRGSSFDTSLYQSTLPSGNYKCQDNAFQKGSFISRSPKANPSLPHPFLIFPPPTTSPNRQFLCVAPRAGRARASGLVKVVSCCAMWKRSKKTIIMQGELSTFKMEFYEVLLNRILLE